MTAHSRTSHHRSHLKATHRRDSCPRRQLKVPSTDTQSLFPILRIRFSTTTVPMNRLPAPHIIHKRMNHPTPHISYAAVSFEQHGERVGPMRLKDVDPRTGVLISRRTAGLSITLGLGITPLSIHPLLSRRMVTLIRSIHPLPSKLSTRGRRRCLVVFAFFLQICANYCSQHVHTSSSE